RADRCPYFRNRPRSGQLPEKHPGHCDQRSRRCITRKHELEGARDGAPGAIQVTDRWHLWHNLAEYAEKTVTRHRACLKEPETGDDASLPGSAQQERAEQEPGGQEDSEGETAAPAGPALAGGLLDACGRERRLVARTRERYAEIRQRTGAGESLGAI